MKQKIIFHLRRIRNFLIPLLVTYPGIWALTLLVRTCKVKIEGLENLQQAKSTSHCLIMFWHNRIGLAPYIGNTYLRNIPSSIFVSNSRDGEILAKIVRRFPDCKAIRVVHRARHQGLKTMIEHLQEKRLISITPDGPRGPRYKIKPGLIYAAQETGALVLPFSWCSNRYWQMSTWDKMIFPKPFSTIYVKFGKLVAVEKDQNDKGAKESKRLEKILTELDHSLYRKAFSSNNLWPK